MNNKDYVSLEVAQLLKDKKINIPTKTYRAIHDFSWDKLHFKKGELLESEFGNREENIVTIPAPHLYDVQNWLREEHHIHILIVPGYFDRDLYYAYRIAKKSLYINYSDNIRNSYQEALNEGIKCAIETLIEL